MSRTSIRLAIPIPEEAGSASPSGRATMVNAFIAALLECGEFKSVLFLHSSDARVPDSFSAAASRDDVHLLNVNRDAELPEFDVILDFGSAIGGALRSSGQLEGVPYVWRHTGIWPEMTAELWSSVVGFRAFDCVVYESPSSLETARTSRRRLNEDLIARLGAESASLEYQMASIANIVDTERFAPKDDDERAVFRARFGIEADAFVLVYLARLDPSSKADVVPLLRVIAGLPEHRGRAPLKLLVAGYGEAGYVDRLEEVIDSLGLDSRVTLHGGIEPNVRHELLACADAGIVLSDALTEGAPNVALEFLASGIPLIASSWDGLRDAVPHDRAGLLVETTWSAWEGDFAGAYAAYSTPPSQLARTIGSQCVAWDLEELSRHIETLWSREDERTRLGRGAREHALASSASVFSEWRELFERLISMSGEARDAAASGQEPLGPAETTAVTLGDHQPLELVVYQGEELDLPVAASAAFAFGQDLLVGVLECAQDRETITVAELARSLGAEGEMGLAPIRRTVLYLMKLGFLCRPRPAS